jgi:hypothetical protein
VAFGNNGMLRFLWSCVISSIGSNYLSDCGLFSGVQSTVNTSVVTIFAGVTEVNVSYRFAAFVSSSDGRSDTAYTTVLAIEAESPVVTTTSSTSVVNENQKLS